MQPLLRVWIVCAGISWTALALAAPGADVDHASAPQPLAAPEAAALAVAAPPAPLSATVRPPPVSPGGLHDRRGRWIFGFGLGVGAMSVHGDRLVCGTCTYEDWFLAASPHFRVGVFVASRLALMGEVQASAQHTTADLGGGGSPNLREAGLMEGAFLAAAQFWIARRLWVKGGAGFMLLYISRSDERVIPGAPAEGIAALGAVGYELWSRTGFAGDVQLRLLHSVYDLASNRTTSATVGAGFNWY